MPVMRSLLVQASQAPDPTILTFGNTELQAPACGVQWQVESAWTILNGDASNFYVRIRDIDTGNIVVGGNFLPAVDSSFIYTGNTGGIGSGFEQTFNVQLELCRSSDGTLLQTSDPAYASVDTGAPC